jgi:hypothetical protein
VSPTVVFESYWKFAAERHRIYEKRLRGEPRPWTADPILSAHKFTNAFRACDRVSQFLIKEVIYNPEAPTDDEEVVFRILLFKLFNSIPAWEILKSKFGTPTWKGFDEKAYGVELGQAKVKGFNIWNMAYVQNQMVFTHLATKHERYLALLDHMMSTNVTGKLQAAESYADAFRVLQSYPLHGKSFIAMQHLTDINYSEVIEFDEDDFIEPGPGALDGIQKCFGTLNGITPSALIRGIVDDQEGFFEAVGEQPVRLIGKRRLHAIDCQNLFCEVDKYARVAHPEFNLTRTKIKQTLQPAGPLSEPFFPPKWKLKMALNVDEIKSETRLRSTDLEHLSGPLSKLTNGTNIKSLAELRDRIQRANKGFQSTVSRILKPGVYRFEIKTAGIEHDEKRGYDYLYLRMLCNDDVLTSDRFPMRDDMLWKIADLLAAVGLELDSWTVEKELVGLAGDLTAEQKGTLVVYRYQPRA